MFGLFKKPDPLCEPCKLLAGQAHIRVAKFVGDKYWFNITVDTKKLAEFAITQEALTAFIETIEERIRNRQIEDSGSILRSDSPLYVVPNHHFGGTTHVTRFLYALNGELMSSWTKGSKRAPAFVNLNIES